MTRCTLASRSCGDGCTFYEDADDEISIARLRTAQRIARLQVAGPQARFYLGPIERDELQRKRTLASVSDAVPSTRSDKALNSSRTFYVLIKVP